MRRRLSPGHHAPEPVDPALDVFTSDEVARAAGVPDWLSERTLQEHRLASLPGGYLTWDGAVTLGRLLAGARPGLFSPTDTTTREPGLPATLSAAAHAAVLSLAILVTSAGLGSVPSASETDVREPMRLVFLATPGPGGGGGGGGLRQKAAPPKAQRKGAMSISSPLPDRKPPEPVAATPPEPEPPPPPKPAEAIQAPVATVAADERDRAGALEQTPSNAESRGGGAGGGVGTGTGTGIGEGTGSGVGPGEGGGTGGGPYRPGSGIEPPRLLREVKPDYTEEARRAGITGEVLLGDRHPPRRVGRRRADPERAGARA